MHPRPSATGARGDARRSVTTGIALIRPTPTDTSRRRPHRATIAAMGISHYIKEIGRGKDGARALAREQAADLFGQVLDGTVTDLEIGAFCVPS